jgi:pilus assembly protein CpaF
MSSALDVLVHLARLRDGSRRIVKVVEVEGMEGDTIVLQDIYRFDYSMGRDAEGRFLGRLKSTGLRPKFAEKLEYMGVTMEPELFKFDPPARR